MLFPKGAIGFSLKRRNWVSKIVAWFTTSRWSHTFVIYQDQPEVLVVEAGTLQVQLVPIAKYQSSGYNVAYFSPVAFTPEQIDAGVAKARESIETTYGWLQILGFVPVIVSRRLFGRKISNPARGGIVCSELVLQYLRGIDPGGKWAGMDKDAVSPEDLFSELALDDRFKLMALEK